MPLRSVLSFVPLLAVPSILAGQASPADTTVLADLVVTATRSETPRRDVPATVSVITGEQLRARGIRFVADWLREVPGVTVVPTGSYGGVTSLFLRGGESDYTKVLIDGVPANLPGGSIDLANLSTENVERIEVLRGPASVLYGSDAVSGVVQILTRRGGGAGRVSGAMRAGTQGTTDLSAGYQGKSGRVVWTGSLSRFGSDGFYEFNSGYRSMVGSARLAAELDPASHASIAVRYGDHKANFPTDFAGVPSDSNQFNTERGLTVALEAGRRVSERVEIQVMGSLFRGSYGFDDVPDTPADTVGFGYAANRESRIGRQILDTRAVIDALSWLLVSGGVEIEHESEEQRSTTTSDFGGGSLTETHEFDRGRFNQAAYVQGRAELWSGVDLHAGLRHDNNEVFGAFTTWRAGLVAVPSNSFRMHVSAGSAFKQPTFSEQFADTPFEVGDPELQPERAFTWEVGVEGALVHGRVTLSATWFDQRFRDLIEYRFAAPGEPTYSNRARASSRGAEIGVRWAPSPSLTVNLSSTWLRTRVEETGERLLRRPSHTVATRVAWLPGNGILLTTDVLWTGSRDDMDFNAFPADRVTLDPFSTLSLSADVPLGGGEGGVGPWAVPTGLAAMGRVENLFGTAYQTVFGFPGRDRSLLLGLRLNR